MKFTELLNNIDSIVEKERYEKKKREIFDMPEETVLISGVFERIGMKESFYTIKLNGEKILRFETLRSPFVYQKVGKALRMFL